MVDGETELCLVRWQIPLRLHTLVAGTLDLDATLHTAGAHTGAIGLTGAGGIGVTLSVTLVQSSAVLFSANLVFPGAGMNALSGSHYLS